MSLFSKIKNVFNSSSIDIPDAQTIYFKNGEMYKVYPTDKESWYDARYLVSDGVKYDLENLDDLKRIPDHEFYVALADKNIKGMQEALDKLLELKLAKRAAKDTLLHFDFYLQPQVLMYAKIAAIHGFDLGIDSPIAPKELIDINPLAEYKIPYDFMKSFDFDAPHQVWVNYVKQRMEEAKQKKVENKKGFWASLFGR